MPNKYLLWIAAGWTFVIAFLCLTNFNSLPSVSVKIQNADKYVHACFHFLFTIFWFLYLNSRKLFTFSRSVVVVLGASIFYGCLIELMQGYFTTTRKADILDVLANSVGGIAAVALIFLYRKTKSNLSSNN